MDATTLLSGDQVSELGLADWRPILDGLQARFATRDFRTGLELVNRIGEVAEFVCAERFAGTAGLAEAVAAVAQADVEDDGVVVGVEDEGVARRTTLRSSRRDSF